MKNNFTEDPRFIAAVDQLRRTGIRTFRIGHSDEEDGDPVIWYAVGTWFMGHDGLPMPKGGRPSHESSAGGDPLIAVLRLCERVIDGGLCVHCGERTIFVEDSDPNVINEMGVLGKMGCVISFDPELKTFRRSCEGDN